MAFFIGSVQQLEEKSVSSLHKAQHIYTHTHKGRRAHASANSLVHNQERKSEFMCHMGHDCLCCSTSAMSVAICCQSFSIQDLLQIIRCMPLCTTNGVARMTKMIAAECRVKVWFLRILVRIWTVLCYPLDRLALESCRNIIYSWAKRILSLQASRFLFAPIMLASSSTSSRARSLMMLLAAVIGIAPTCRMFCSSAATRAIQRTHGHSTWRKTAPNLCDGIHGRGVR